jgi:hypothetical protein
MRGSGMFITTRNGEFWVMSSKASRKVRRALDGRRKDTDHPLLWVCAVMLAIFAVVVPFLFVPEGYTTQVVGWWVFCLVVVLLCVNWVCGPQYNRQRIKDMTYRQDPVAIDNTNYSFSILFGYGPMKTHVKELTNEFFIELVDEFFLNIEVTNLDVLLKKDELIHDEVRLYDIRRRVISRLGELGKQIGMNDPKFQANYIAGLRDGEKRLVIRRLRERIAKSDTYRQQLTTLSNTTE